MSQKIIIPKGTIDSAHTTIIEIPNYLHETSTVVVTTPKTADASLEETWDVNQYVEEDTAEQNEGNWEQSYDAEAVEEGEYSGETQEQYAYQYEPQGQESEGEVDQQQVEEQSRTYVAEEVPAAPRRPKYDPYVEHMRRRMIEKRRELEKLKEERARMLEGDMGTAYENAPPQNAEEAPRNLSEVPENMRGKQAYRENMLEKEKKRRHQEFERYQPSQVQGPYQQVQQVAPKYVQNPAYANVDPQQQQQLQQQQQQQQQLQQQLQQPQQQQWNPEIQGYPPQMQYPRHVYPRSNYQKRQMYPQQPGVVRDDGRQYQKARRKPTFSLPAN